MALKKGDKDDQVAEIQELLKEAKFYIGAIDGIFGSETEKAVKDFQKSFGLKVDGVVGPATDEALRDPGCLV